MDNHYTKLPNTCIYIYIFFSFFFRFRTFEEFQFSSYRNFLFLSSMLLLLLFIARAHRPRNGRKRHASAVELERVKWKKKLFSRRIPSTTPAQEWVFNRWFTPKLLARTAISVARCVRAKGTACQVSDGKSRETNWSHRRTGEKNTGADTVTIQLRSWADNGEGTGTTWLARAEATARGCSRVEAKVI